jgi:hypothetical protein
VFGRSFPKALQRRGKFVAEQGEFALDAIRAANHHVVGPGNALGWDNFAGERAQPALQAVADDRPTDFFGDRKADAHRFIRILAVTHEQDKSGSRHAAAAVRGEEVGALLDRG